MVPFFFFMRMYLLACSTRLGEPFICADGGSGNMDSLSEELGVLGGNICFNGFAEVHGRR